MTTLYSLTSTQALSNLRTDLSDADSTNYRWSDASLNRAINKALERYSWASPWIQSQQIPTITQCVIYGTPTGAWYIDRVEYPAGRYPKNFPPFLERKSPLIMAPSASATSPAAVSFAAGGTLASGSYSYTFIYVVPGGGETTTGGDITFRANAITNAVATLSNIPIGPYGVSARNIYRSDHTGNPATYALVGQVANNTSMIFIDIIPDANRGAAPPSSNTTQNLDQFELQIPPELFPSDTTTYYVEVAYATLHQLGASGTTVPERHWDVLYYGAVAYAMESYLPAVNDNFEYADGHLRDRVDDTKSTIAWQTQCRLARDDFNAKLVLIKEESDAAVALATHWGDKPIRWERL